MIVPSWMYWVAIAALGAAVLGQQVRVSNAQRATAQLRLDYEKEQRGRADDLAKYREEKATIAATHATNQQELTDAFNKKLRLAQDAVNERSALVGRLRGQLASYTTLDRTSGAPDAVIIERATHRLATLGGLFDEGLGLVAEGAAHLERRDAEVAALVEQVRVDRLACQVK